MPGCMGAVTVADGGVLVSISWVAGAVTVGTTATVAPTAIACP